VATEIAEILQLGPAFRDRLRQAKAAAGPPELWYPYSTMSNLDFLAELMTDEYRFMLDPGSAPSVADIGAADGDMAFFLWSLGTDVDIVDHARTNFNGLEGARRLARELDSPVRVVDTDLDQHFTLPRARYDLVFFLGVLYHLRNPYNALESLARYTSYCVLSTRVARLTSDRMTRIDDLPVAYLLDPSECNNDATNFWIFSESGLRRILERTGWRVVRWLSAGEPDSDPASTSHDQRIFCLIKSSLEETEPDRFRTTGDG
jgi:hypothetical protein